MLTGSKLLMTGITGQIGGSIARLMAPHNEVHGLARYTSPQSRAAVEALGVTPIVCDYTKGDFTGIPDDFDYVLHIAADVFPASFDIGVHQNAEGAGLLFNHFRSAKAWIYVSTTGVYWDHPHPWYRYKEADRLGGSTRITSRYPYGPTKFAGEAVARTMSRIHNVPVTIPRMNWSYGLSGHGGLPARLIANVHDGLPTNIHPDWENVGSPIHEDDFAGQIEGFFAAATVGGTIMNWAGDEPTSIERIVPWLAQAMGREGKFNVTREATSYPRATDNARRLAAVGPCKVNWRDGFRRLIKHHYPDLVINDVPDPEPVPAGPAGSTMD